MEQLAERGQRLVGGHDDKAPLEVAIVDNPVEDVGSIKSIALVSELVLTLPT